MTAGRRGVKPDHLPHDGERLRLGDVGMTAIIRPPRI